MTKRYQRRRKVTGLKLVGWLRANGCPLGRELGATAVVAACANARDRVEAVERSDALKGAYRLGGWPAVVAMTRELVTLDLLA